MWTFRSISLARWCPPLEGVLKFNIDGISRDKPGPTVIGGVLRNFKCEVLTSFSKSIGIKDSNEVEGTCHFRGFENLPDRLVIT